MGNTPKGKGPCPAPKAGARNRQMGRSGGTTQIWLCSLQTDRRQPAPHTHPRAHMADHRRRAETRPHSSCWLPHLRRPSPQPLLWGCHPD